MLAIYVYSFVYKGDRLGGILLNNHVFYIASLSKFFYFLRPNLFRYTTLQGGSLGLRGDPGTVSEAISGGIVVADGGMSSHPIFTHQSGTEVVSRLNSLSHRTTDLGFHAARTWKSAPLTKWELLRISLCTLVLDSVGELTIGGSKWRPILPSLALQSVG